MGAVPVSFLGIPWFVRRALCRRAVTFLVYHDPSPYIFDRHISWLKNHYSIVSIDQAVDALSTGSLSQLGEYPLVITIDDGHKRNINLLPIIKKYDIRPCIYLCSAIVGTNRPFSDQLISSNFPELRSEFKQQSESGRREMFRCLAGLELESELDVPVALSKGEIAEMVPYVDFGSHGRFHQSMPFLEADDLYREMMLSKLEIESLSGLACKHFSFPTGLYDEKSIRVAKEVGYCSLRTTDAGFNDSQKCLNSLSVCGISDDATLAKLEVQAAGIYHHIRQFLQRRGSM